MFHASRRVEPGSTCILALSATFNRQAYPAWVQSGAGGAAFVKMPNEAFRRLFDTEIAFREFIFGVLSGRIFDLMQSLEEASSLRLEQRVAAEGGPPPTGAKLARSR